jgi:hypothetical protein
MKEIPVILASVVLFCGTVPAATLINPAKCDVCEKNDPNDPTKCIPKCPPSAAPNETGCCKGKCFDPDVYCCIKGKLVRKEPITSLIHLLRCRNRVQRTAPVVNGCSTPLPDDNNPIVTCRSISFLDACNAHDVCYQTCYQGGLSALLSAKAICDVNFFFDLMDICNLHSSCAECTFWAWTYYSAVAVAGLPAFIGDQQIFCKCCP